MEHGELAQVIHVAYGLPVDVDDHVARFQASASGRRAIRDIVHQDADFDLQLPREISIY